MSRQCFQTSEIGHNSSVNRSHSILFKSFTAMKILCATDFTHHSDRAAVAANAIAYRCGASLEFVHIRESVSKHFHASDEVTLALTIARGASVRLEERANSFSKEHTSPTWKLLSSENGETLASTLARHATETQVDLIVVSTHGKSGSKLWPMGSLAAAIVAASPVPVLVVHSSEPFVAWKDLGIPPLKLFVGLDLNEESGQVLQALQKFHLDRETKITAGFVQMLHSFIGDPLVIDIQTFPEDEKHLKHRIQYLVDKYLKNTTAEIKVETGFYSPAHYLVEMAKHEDADMVVVGTHQRSGMTRLLEGSVSRGVLRESMTSVLCVPLHQLERKANAMPEPKMIESLDTERSIFCATDFSERSSEAALASQALALRFGTTYEIAHVVEDYHIWPGLPKDAIHTLHAGASSRLKQFVDPLIKRGLSPQQTILDATGHESIADCLLKHLEATQPILAVISTHGKSDDSWFSIGSTARRIAHESPVPVLITRTARPFKHWIESEEKIHILGAIDTDDEAQEVLEWMKHFGDAGPCSFTLAYIDKSHSYYYVPQPLEEQAITDYVDSLTFEECKIREKAKSILGEKADITALAKHNWDGVSDGLLQVAQDAKIDMIILGTHQWHGMRRWLHRSVTTDLINRSEISLLCLPMRPQIIRHDKDISSILP